MTNEQLKDSKALCTECEGLFSASELHFPNEFDGWKVASMGIGLCGDCCWGWLCTSCKAAEKAAEGGQQ
jgi:hypothetical protein